MWSLQKKKRAEVCYQARIARVPLAACHEYVLSVSVASSAQAGPILWGAGVEVCRCLVCAFQAYPARATGATSSRIDSTDASPRARLKYNDYLFDFVKVKGKKMASQSDLHHRILVYPDLRCTETSYTIHAMQKPTLGYWSKRRSRSSWILDAPSLSLAHTRLPSLINIPG